MPKFSSDSGELTLDENFPKGLDFSYLLKVDNKSLSVSDKDLPFQLLTFDVSDPRFEALEPILRDESDNGHPRIRYEPRIAVKMQLDSAASPIKFNLIAKVKTLHFEHSDDDLSYSLFFFFQRTQGILQRKAYSLLQLI